MQLINKKTLTAICLCCNNEFIKKQNIVVKYCSLSCSNIHRAIIKNKKDEDAYNINPNKCKHCNSMILFKNRKNKFCNTSCAAKYNNLKHSPESRCAQRTTLIQNWVNDEKIIYQCNVFFNTCVSCNNIFTAKLLTTRICSPHCYTELKRVNMLTNNRAQIQGSLGGRVTASKRIIRSKDEIKLYEKIKQICPDALSNHIIKDGWDADIVIPSKQIAVMWNGPWHYKNLGIKGHSVKQVQNRDQIKQKLFTQEGYTVLMYEDRYYTPETAFIHFQGVITGMVASLGIEPN